MMGMNAKREEGRGTIAVEMVILLPILLFLLAGAFNLARLIDMKQKVVMAARIGAQAAATPPRNDPRRALYFPFDRVDFFGKRRAEQAVEAYLRNIGLDPSRASVVVYTIPYGWWAGRDSTIPESRRRTSWEWNPPHRPVQRWQDNSGVGVIHPFIYKIGDIFNIMSEGSGPANPNNAHARPFVSGGYFSLTGGQGCGCHRVNGEGPHDLDAIRSLRFDKYEFRPYGWMIGVRVEYEYPWPWMVKALYAAASVLAGNPVPDWQIRLKGNAAFPVPMSLPEIIAVHEHLRETFNPLKFAR